ncbi:iron-sulfur cluster assembly accessory protein [Luteimonas composti]|uniref:Iron-sulfur cluster assembly accessory protein n=1 Tax=Luteimonas composti TaxID=398257 RepID=A0ABT6MMQ2_9GAMM|nr:iron-sulfur cluster assembly accessory protein [Luteimonas composti]MDH7451704.1 iron-sulfur cluster assembly accessory protein [Luteimonas composti]
MPIQLTPAAFDRVRQFLDGSPDAIGLRFGVKRTGCSGWGYEVELAREARAGDSVSEQDGVRIYVDASSLPMVDGTTIDFVRKGLNHEFVFDNPRAAAECGCGESFTTDADRVA